VAEKKRLDNQGLGWRCSGSNSWMRVGIAKISRVNLPPR